MKPHIEFKHKDKVRDMVVAIIKEVFDSATVKLNPPENGPDDNEYDEEVAIENNELEINRGETVDPPAAVTNKAQDDETNSENFYFHHYVIENDRSLNEDYRRVEESIENVQGVSKKSVIKEIIKLCFISAIYGPFNKIIFIPS